ncbi:MAG TPA: penicillin acylase family protein [Stellaceae bacterium]|nr:penicillin acylase family protein [Stellaceae bacterium]
MRWRWRLLIALLLLPLVVVASGLLWLRGSLPRTSGTIALAGPSAEIRITRDAAGVPHIAAANDRDAAFALGFVHAQDRLFQMDMMRRLGAGRLSEVLGPATLATDRTMRTLGLYRLAEAEFAALSPALREALEAYAAGVNAFLAEGRTLPPEYAVLRTRPEEWRPADSLVWAKYMALILAGNYRSELLRAQIATHVTPEQLAQLYPQYPKDAPVTLGQLAALYRALPLDRIYAALPAVVGPTFASNNWVVDGAHSATGKPILANDPHLGFATPDVWYLARIDTPDHHLAGATAPGTPFIVIGHNDRIGWGFTTTEGDVEDVFVERLDPTDPGRYLTPDGAQPFATREEEIGVRGEAPVKLTVRSTRHGPVISDLGGATAPAGYVLALQATFLAPGDRSPQALWDVNRARNWDEFNAALQNLVAPEQNIVYADVEGHIGFTAPARIPIRGKGDGWMPVPGWTGEYDWTGFIPFTDLPRAFDPPRGRFVSANNKIVPDSYPYFIARDWDIPNRAERIEALLDEAPKQSLDASAAIQADTLSLMAQRLLPLMLKIQPSDARMEAALDLLRRWDGRMDENAAAPLVFTAWLRELERAIFADRLGVAFESYWALRPLAVREIMTEHPEWCRDPARPADEGCTARLQQSLSRALDELVRAHGADMTAWRWGAAHVATFAHPLFSRIPVLRDVLAVAIPAGGGSDTVNRGGMFIADPEHPFRDVHGSGLRMLLDFSDLDRSRFMVVPGQSGNPFSPHYADLLRPWHDFAWLTLGREVQGSTLLLVPR